MRIFRLLTALWLGVSLATPAFAQNYPSRPIRLVVPFSAGGPADLIAREVGQKLGNALGQTVVIDNQGGGAGMNALSMVVGSEPDGHTLLMAASGNIVLQPYVSKTGGKDLLPKLRPVGLVSTSPHLLVVSSKLPVDSIESFIAYAKAHPDKLSYASAGHGGVAHLGMEYLKARTGMVMTHIPYRGTAAAINDLSSGQVHALFSSPPSLQAAIDRGYVKPLGISAASGHLTSLPVIGSVVPDFEFTTWYGLFAPEGVPAATIERIGTELAKVLADPELATKIAAQGVELQSSSAAELAQIVQRDTAKWADIIRQANITVE